MSEKPMHSVDEILRKGYEEAEECLRAGPRKTRRVDTAIERTLTAVLDALEANETPRLADHFRKRLRKAADAR